MLLVTRLNPVGASGITDHEHDRPHERRLPRNDIGTQNTRPVNAARSYLTLPASP